ncbi:hypothetical protein VTP01DRAFT_8133 [Rhizomucor pusillus]|uniref:uncharacterized protein n=1 Tax=Rhizomucor pusillus TaxID=4840 RepID=UPI0037437B21
MARKGRTSALPSSKYQSTTPKPCCFAEGTFHTARSYAINHLLAFSHPLAQASQSIPLLTHRPSSVLTEKLFSSIKQSGQRQVYALVNPLSLGLTRANIIAVVILGTVTVFKEQDDVYVKNQTESVGTLLKWHAFRGYNVYKNLDYTQKMAVCCKEGHMTFLRDGWADLVRQFPSKIELLPLASLIDNNTIKI